MVIRLNSYFYNNCQATGTGDWDWDWDWGLGMGTGIGDWDWTDLVKDDHRHDLVPGPVVEGAECYTF